MTATIKTHFTEIDDKQLLRYHDMRMPHHMIAKNLGFTQDSISSRIEYLEALEMEQDKFTHY